MPVPALLREMLKTAALAAGALVLVATCALELEAWAVRTSKGGGWHGPDQGRLIRTHIVEQPTVGVIT